MNSKKVEATLEERISKKGTKYECVVIKITDNMEKLVFLNPAEIELIKMNKTTPIFGK